MDTDVQRGLSKAEIVGFDHLVETGSMAVVRLGSPAERYGFIQPALSAGC